MRHSILSIFAPLVSLVFPSSFAFALVFFRGVCISGWGGGGGWVVVCPRMFNVL